VRPKGPVSFEESTSRFRTWLGHRITVTDAEWETRRQRLADCTVFEFFRATFYRWAQWWPVVCHDLDDAPQVLGIGDLHVENFGTWRDAEDRLVWGVNDFDEACCLPWTHDLVRLATSVRFAMEERQQKAAKQSATSAQPGSAQPGSSAATQHASVDHQFRNACAAILDGYVSTVVGTGRDGRRPVVLAEDETSGWLRDIVLTKLQGKSGRSQFAEFLEVLNDLSSLDDGVPMSAWDALRHGMPEGVGTFRVGRREAGLGSLGRQRFTAVVDDWRGGLLAREVKALAPSAWRWWTEDGSQARGSLSDTLLAMAVRSPDPSVTVIRGEHSWIQRRLAPDSGRVKLKDLPKDGHLEDDLLRAMGHETANVHVALGNVRTDVQLAARQDPTWLQVAAGEMAQRVTEDLSGSR
jgi:hypothetical protein